MAKAKTPVKGKKTVKKIEHLHIRLTNKNYMIIGLGIAVMLVGYFFMNANSVDGFLPTVIAPIVLVIAYGVIIPFGILFEDKSGETQTENTVTTAPVNVSVN